MDPNQQQPYGAPPQYPQQPVYATPAATPSKWGMSSLGGIGAEVLAGLAYLSTILLGPVIPIVLFFIEKNRFAKFHAAQAMLISIGAFVLFVAVFILQIIVGIISGAVGQASSTAGGLIGLVGLIFVCLYPLVGIAFLGLWIWGMIAAFTGKPTKLPVIGNFAERLAGGPVAPAL